MTTQTLFILFVVFHSGLFTLKLHREQFSHKPTIFVDQKGPSRGLTIITKRKKQPSEKKSHGLEGGSQGTQTLDCFERRLLAQGELARQMEG